VCARKCVHENACVNVCVWECETAIDYVKVVTCMLVMVQRRECECECVRIDNRSGCSNRISEATEGCGCALLGTLVDSYHLE